MRISILTETYVPQVNGVSRTLAQLVRVLTESGDQVQLIHPDYGLPAVEADHYLVPAIRVPFYPEIHLPLPSDRGVRRALSQFQPDLVHIATEATLGLSALQFAHSSGIPAVSSFHTNFDQYSTHYRIGWSRGLIWRYLRWFHNRTRETYVPSRSTIKTLEARGFDRLVLWPRGVDADLFRPDRPGRDRVRSALGFGPDDVVIAYVGRLAAEKNIDFLAEALEIVSRSRTNAKPLIVGDGPSRVALTLRLQGRATFVGFRDGNDLADHYAAADLFAFASRTETFGNVVLEAMASGLPVVALAAGGPAEFIRTGDNGEAIDPDATPSDFAHALIRLVDDHHRRRWLSHRAREHAQSQSWDAIMLTLRDRYRCVIESSSQPDRPFEASIG